LVAPENTYPNRKEGRVEGVVSEEGEVVTRQVYENVRLDHLLSKEPIEETAYRKSVSWLSSKEMFLI
jgi:hypothetical protein